MGLTFATCEDCGPDRRLLVRLKCGSCGKVVARVVRTRCGLVWSAKPRRRMREATLDEAIRWEFGTSTTGPMTGSPPAEVKIRPIVLDWHLADPRRSDQSGAHVDHLVADCGSCGQGGLRVTRAAFADVLTRYDAEGKAQDETVHAYND